ncbi:DHH family phosphoesterase [Persephonella sp.]
MGENVICIYHKNCTDGTASAAILLTKYPDCKLYPLEHGYKEEDIDQILSDVDGNSIVFITDFSLRKEDLLRLLEKAKKVINIDHHIGVKDLLEEIAENYRNFEFYFDNNHSGSSLTWKYLYGDNLPEIIKLVEDKDIWKWEFGEKTKFVNAYLTLLTNKPEDMKELFNKEIEYILEKGKIISQFTDYLIERFIEKSEELLINIGNYTVRGYNTGLFQSEIGNILSEKLGEAVALFSVNGYNVKFSFRSCDGQKPSALELAQILGGGGHRNAAGASVQLKDFCKMILFPDGGKK